MDMSVKLNLSYPAVAPQSAAPIVVGKSDQPKAEAVVSPDAEPKREDLEKAVTDIQEFVQAAQRKLDFSIDDSSGRIVVKVIATETGDVIRQIPSETALKLAQSLSDASNLLFNDRV
ncbi:flagellar protein FlaG [Pseudomonas thivervalensis]|jgi:flagellar protein FlaG|uniref:Flagellar biosynthesis protein FlaG n=1 Tax=Pseudomonas thivervalensis TaxID=86265 RepID=A0A176NH58_9PSED|nr:flagellar protein FlaG [Pseudomonas thivervalensis]AXA55054.1 flagellar biosynthesis protein FlaG [Pseudomonas thivervalensis]AXA60737.1 flagellar biosynthesis protein FlaG [Pseudomonas thivervalensis]OAB50468.1 flagellar biosynthesis protein FlaG [Pseudomonas thivervalensis]SDF94014.1 flagellar protein FlaG [Pseudomonas thivervalensis]